MSIRVWGVLGLALIAGGCSTNSDVVSSRIIPASFTDKICADVARDRAHDAALNGYDAADQVVVARSSYGTCLTTKEPRHT